MASLEDHMRELGDHSRLGYRADCAVCRLERENRHLPESKLRATRAQATALALLMGVSGGAAGAGPAAAADEGPVAGEEHPDAQREPPPGETVEVEVPVPPPAAGRAPVTDSGARHVVRPGDTLESIARSLLGPTASQAEVSAEAERLWELNRVRIAGGDPRVVSPGEVLAVPSRR